MATRGESWNRIYRSYEVLFLFTLNVFVCCDICVQIYSLDMFSEIFNSWFQAFSGYYAVIRDLNLTSNASLDQLENATKNICRKSWDEVSTCFFCLNVVNYVKSERGDFVEKLASPTRQPPQPGLWCSTTVTMCLALYLNYHRLLAHSRDR